MQTFNKRGDSKRLNPEAWVLALTAAPGEFLELAARAFELVEDWYSRFAIGAKLHELDPARFDKAMGKLTAEQLLAKDTHAEIELWTQAQQSAIWLVANRGHAALPQLKDYFSAALGSGDWHRNSQAEYKNEVLDVAVQKLGHDALPLLEACFATDQPEVQLRALQLWSGLRTAGEPKASPQSFAKCSRPAMLPPSPEPLVYSGDLVLEAVEDDLWFLLSHKSRPVRDAAATTLAKLGESRLPKATGLWAARRVDPRLAAVTWLNAVGTAKAAATLKARLDDEEDDNVRDAILLALERLEGGSRVTDPAELRGRIKKTLAKIKGPPVPWLAPEKIPAPKLLNGSKLPTDSLLYLLYRQSRVKDMRPGIEAKALYAQIDRKTSGELGLAVLAGLLRIQS